MPRKPKPTKEPSEKSCSTCLCWLKANKLCLLSGRRMEPGDGCTEHEPALVTGRQA